MIYSLHQRPHNRVNMIWIMPENGWLGAALEVHGPCDGEEASFVPVKCVIHDPGVTGSVTKTHAAYAAITVEQIASNDGLHVLACVAGSCR